MKLLELTVAMTVAMTVAKTVAKESVEPETVKKRISAKRSGDIGRRHIMSSDRICLLRRPLPPKRFPPVVETPPAPGPSAGAVLQSLFLDQGDAGVRGSSRQEASTPAPRAAPPTPLLPDASTPWTDRITEGFPRKPPRTRPQNPLLKLLQSDTRFLPPPPAFCLSDFLQSHNGVRQNSQSPPV